MNVRNFNRNQRMGAINASSTAGTSAGNIAQTAASLVNTASGAVKGVLQAEAAQNAINAQKNLTSALTPGVITLGLFVLGYWLVTKK
jgi:outer membrane lipoprotein SlyB